MLTDLTSRFGGEIDRAAKILALGLGFTPTNCQPRATNDMRNQPKIGGSLVAYECVVRGGAFDSVCSLAFFYWWDRRGFGYSFIAMLNSGFSRRQLVQVSGSGIASSTKSQCFYSGTCQLSYLFSYLFEWINGSGASSGSTETFKSHFGAAPHCCKTFKCFDKLIRNQKGQWYETLDSDH